MDGRNSLFFCLACLYQAISTHCPVRRRQPSHRGRGTGYFCCCLLCFMGLWARMENSHSLTHLGLACDPCAALVKGCQIVSFSALHTGHPQPKLTWFKDGRPLAGGDAHHISPDGVLLQVLQANLSSAGHYSCIAANAVGEKTRHFQLSVLCKFWTSGHRRCWREGEAR